MSGSITDPQNARLVKFDDAINYSEATSKHLYFTISYYIGERKSAYKFDPVSNKFEGFEGKFVVSFDERYIVNYKEEKCIIIDTTTGKEITYPLDKYDFILGVSEKLLRVYKGVFDQGIYTNPFYKSDMTKYPDGILVGNNYAIVSKVGGLELFNILDGSYTPIINAKLDEKNITEFEGGAIINLSGIGKYVVITFEPRVFIEVKTTPKKYKVITILQ
jgi:hypothetical protein